MILLILIIGGVAIFCFSKGYIPIGIICIGGFSKKYGFIALIITSVFLFINKHWFIGSLPFLLIVWNILWLKLFVKRRVPLKDYSDEMLSSKKYEELTPQFFSASFISKRATKNTFAIINQFPEYFQNIKTQRQFYLNMLCLYFDIFHRLGAGLIGTEDSNIPSVKLMDERIGMVVGMSIPIIKGNSKKIPFMQKISLDLINSTFKEFHNWSLKFDEIYDKENALSVKYASKKIEGFSIKGENTLIINFISVQIEKLSVQEIDLGRFIFNLSDLIDQYLMDIKSFIEKIK